ncbi:MAG: tetratricopeptide repeat protein, partial [Planctomycetota bacterium]
TQRQRELEAQAHAQQQQLARVREMAQQGRIADLQRELNVKLVAQRTQQIEDFNARLEQARQRGVPAAEFVRNLGSDERLALIAAFDRARKLHAEQPDAITYDTVDVTYHSLLVAFHNPRDPRPVEWLGELIAAQPHDPFLFNLRGILHQERGDLKAAEADYTATLALTPDAAETLTNRALARAGSGNTAGAIADATRALELQPDYLNAWRAMGVANHMQGRLPEAIDAYSEVLRRRPQHVQCRVMRADAYCELKKYREGMDDFAQALKDEPGSPHALMTRAHAWERMRRNNKAIEDYTTVIDANPLASEALGRRGACHLAEGNHADALRDLREAVRLAPDRSLFHFNLAITLVHTGDRAAAKQAFADAERTAPSEAARQQVISERKALLGE